MTSPPEDDLDTPWPDADPILRAAFRQQPVSAESLAEDFAFPYAGETTLFGDFLLLREIGRGGMGIVYEAEQQSLGRKVAIKLIKRELLDRHGAHERFRREAQAASRLDHPGICPVLEAGEIEGIPYIAMRYVEGETLAARLREAMEAPPESPHATASAPSSRDEIMAVVHLLEKVARALHAAHEQGLIHRDLKPGNIMVTPEGEPVILDFGLARLEDGNGESLTRTGDLVGTPAFMAPEQLGAEPADVDRRIDVYALGITLFQSLSFHLPYDAPTREQLYRQILTGDPPDIRRVNPRIPRDIKVVVETALERDRDRRYRSALALAEDLRRVRRHEPILARPAGPVLRLRRWSRRRPALAVLLLVLAIGIPSVAALGGYIFARWDEMEAGREQALLERVERHLESGFVAILEKHPRKAIEAFEAVRGIKPDSLEAIAGLVFSKLDLGEYRSALSLLDQHRGSPLHDTCLGYLRVIVLRKMGSTEKADTLEKALPQPATALEFYVAGFHETGKLKRRQESGSFDRVLGHFSSAILHAGHARAIYHLQLAATAHNAKDYSTLGHVTRALVNNWPDWHAAWSNRGVYFLETGDHDRAREALQKAIHLSPGGYGDCVNMGNVYRAMGRRDQAIEWYRKAVTLDADAFEAHTNLGVVQVEGGQYESAVATFRKALARGPRWAAFHSYLGLALTYLGRLDDALASCQKAVELNPEFGDYWMNLGRAQSMMGNRVAAIESYEKAIDLRPGWAAAHSNLGRCLAENGDVNGAEEAFRKAIQSDADHAPARTGLGVLLARAQDFEGAIVQFQKALEMEPGNARTRLRLAISLNNQGDLLQAHAVLLQGYVLAKKLERPVAPFLARNRESCEREMLRFARAAIQEGFPHAASEPGTDRERASRRRGDAARHLEAILRGWHTDLDGQLRDPRTIMRNARALVRDRKTAAIRSSGALDLMPEEEQECWRDIWKQLDELIRRLRNPSDR